MPPARGRSSPPPSLRGRSIAFCMGCLACQSAGQCVIQDDAVEIAEKMGRAEVIAFATPIYYYEMSGQMKTLLDRANALFASDYAFRDIYLLTAAAEEEYMEDPQEAEKIEEALLAQGYFSLAVPMPYEWQDYMRTYCEEYGCPYPLALAVAQTESNFDMDAVGASGEVGIMQLNPGPGGSYHAEIQAATGLDPTTTSGNIAGGCYKLGLYLAKYGNVEKAAMAYNMGEGGARSAWDSGITSTDYSKAVKEAMETWECTVNAWGGV